MGSFTKLSFKMAAAMLVAACAILVPLSLSEDSAAVSTESELIDAVGTGGNIAIDGTITLTSTLVIDSGATLSLSGGSLTVSDADGATENSVISVTNGNVTLSNITITGGTETAIAVSGGSLTIGDGVTITESKTGISVTGGSLTVNGGNITGNNGGEAGGIFVSGSSTFLMTGGNITGNQGTSAGGILIRNNTGAIISGGTISENAIQSYGAGGIGLDSGSSLTITGGTVRNNTGAGIASLSGSNNLTMGSSESISTIIVTDHSGNGNVLLWYQDGSVALDVTIRGNLTGSDIWFTGESYWLGSVSLNTDYRFAKLDGTYHDSMLSTLHLNGADDAIAAYVDSSGKLLVGEEGTELLGGPDHSGSTQSDMYFTIATPESDTLYVSQDRGGNGTEDRPFGTIADAVDRARAIGATKVVLLSNLTSQPAVEVSTSITLDLNGFSITSGNDSALILDDPAVTSSGLGFNIVGTGTIQGAAGQDGESGNAGISGSFTGTITLGSGVTVRGGDGGDGYYYESTLTPGGAGGSGISLSGATVILDGATIRGGNGGDGASGDNPSNGGNGGAGIVANTVTVIASTTTSTVIAGNGGNGGSSTVSNGGAGGNGGTPLSLTNTTVESQGGSFIGGNGGNGGYSQTGTPGSAGSAGAIDESITITGSDNATQPGNSGVQGNTPSGGESVTITITYEQYDGTTSPYDNAEVTLVVGTEVRAYGVTNESGIVVLTVSYGVYNVIVNGQQLSGSYTISSSTLSITVSYTSGPPMDVEVTGDAGLIADDLSALEGLASDSELGVIMDGSTVSADFSQYLLTGQQLFDYYDVTLMVSYMNDGTATGWVTPDLNGSLVSFLVPIPTTISILQDMQVSDYSSYIIVYTQHNGEVPVQMSRSSGTQSGYQFVEAGGDYYVRIFADRFSVFAIGYAEPTPSTPSTPSTSITAEAIDNLIYITITNPQAGREYAVRDAAGALQTSWTSGTGTIRFGPFQPGDTYSVVGRSTVLLRESVDAVFVIPEVPEIIVVAVTAESVTLASEEGVRYTLTDADGRTVGRVTGTGSDILWDDLDAGAAYYAEAEVGQGRIILTAGPVLVKPAMDGTVVGDIRHEEAYVYVEGSEGWEYRMDGGAWMSSERIVFGPLSPGIAVLESRETESGITMEKRIDVPIVPTRAESTETSVTITTEEGKTYMLSDVDGASAAGPGGVIWVAGTGGDVTWEDFDPAVDYFVHIQTGEGEDAMLFGPETVKLAEEVVQVSGTNEGFSVYITIDNLSPDREYAVAGGDGNPVTEWVTGTPGPVEFGPFEFGATYLVLSREAGSTETLGGLQVEATLVIPEAPDFGSAEYADGVLTMDSVEEWRYQLVDPSGGPVDSGSGIWTDGTGGTLTWTGLDQAGDYFMYAALEDGVLSMSLGPMQVAALVSWTLGDETADVEAASTDKVTIDSVEGSSYMLTDSEGNIAPGPGGQIWVVGTGDALVWTGLDPEKDYCYTIRTVDPETGEVVQSGPYAIPRASEPADPGNPAYALVVVVLIIAYIAFMRLVHREGPFDRRAWLVTAAVLIIAAATGLLYSGIWWQAGITVLAAAAFLSWLYYSDRAAPESRGGS